MATQPIRVFVSNRLANVMNGTTFYSHKVAFVSIGAMVAWIQAPHSTETTGMLTLKGDDKGEVLMAEVEQAV
jgi:hypothetical protein